MKFKDGGMFNNKRTVTGSLHKNGSDVPGGKCALLSVSKFSAVGLQVCSVGAACCVLLRLQALHKHTEHQHTQAAHVWC